MATVIRVRWPTSHTSRRRLRKKRSNRASKASQEAKAVWQGSLAEGRSQGQAPVDSSWPLVGGWGSARQKGKRRAGWEGFNKQTVSLSIWCPCVEGRGRSSESYDDGSGCLCSPRKNAGLRGRTTNVVEDSRAQPEERALPQLPAGPCALPSRTPHPPGFSPASPVASFHSLLLIPPLQPSFLQGGVRQDSDPEPLPYVYTLVIPLL